MRRLFAIISALALSLGSVFQVDSSELELATAPPGQIRWPTTTIKVAVSSSLKNPGPNIKLGSDAVRAAYRALSRWSTVADLNFVISESALQSVSQMAGDGVSLITIADTPQNNAIFNEPGTTGKTRIFYDEVSGRISEADIVINPHPTSTDGAPVQFSTDGTPGTYDLESTLTHEIGHLLGLEHSPIPAATMHERQPLNGLYGKPAFTQRTLSEEDRARVLSIYVPTKPAGVIEGVLASPIATGKRSPLSRTEVWVEDSVSGRVIAGTFTSASGKYRIAGLPPNSYRVLTRQLAQSDSGVRRALNQTNLDNGFRDVRLSASEVKTLDLIPSHPAGPTFLNPRLVGTNGELSNKPVPAEAGKQVKVYVAGEGLDQVTESGISVTSPYFVIQPGTLRPEPFQTFYPVVSFDVSVAPHAAFGDYTIRLQSMLNEVAYVAGAITIDPAVESEFANPLDDSRFYVKQQYRDLLSREADAAGLEYWTLQIEECGDDEPCRRARRLDVAVSLLSGTEFSEAGALIHRIYRLSLGRSPRFDEFLRGSTQLQASTTADAELKIALALVRHDEFLARYPANLNSNQFVDALLKNVKETSGIDLITERSGLAALFDGSEIGRASIVRAVGKNSGVVRAEHERTYAMMQFFGYLRRDPDEQELKSMLAQFENRGRFDQSPYKNITCSFVNSAAYQYRFGMTLTHSQQECRASNN